MNYNFNESINKSQPSNSENGRLKTAQFGRYDEAFFQSSQSEQQNRQQHIENQQVMQMDDLNSSNVGRVRSQQKMQNSSSNNNNENNIVPSLIPNIIYNMFNFWQQPPLQQNDQQQKQVIKSNQIGELKLKPQQSKISQQNNDGKQKLLQLGVEEKYILNGEKYISEIQAGLKSATFRLEGNLILTNYKLIYIVTNGKYDCLGSPDFYHIQLMLIQSCERTVEKKGNQFSYIDIQCKDVRKYQFRFKFEQNDESFDFMTTLVENAFTKDILRYPAFAFKRNNDLDSNYDGWNLYNIKKEFERMKLQIYDENNARPNDQVQYLFKYLNNEQKEVCETYPPHLVVPNNMPDDQIKKCSKFRSRERLPVLTFAYRSTSEQKIPITLWRCSQCRTGFNSRSSEDEMMLRYIGDPTIKDHKSQNNNVNVHIYDARPFINAVGNKIAGKGYENTNCYKNCEIQFLDIHNIHKVRDSFNKMIQLCQSPDMQTRWFKEIDQAQWLEYISTILSGADRICQSMIGNFNVVVHCSDGWDRTTQLVCLAQIFLDPYYRTIEGFSILIEKDWVYFGHQFNLRLAHSIRNQTEETSPVFLQFLDCVHQVMTQYPLSFEFNEQFLVDLAFSSYNCIFGTFLKNYYQELIEQNIMKQTVSVWSWIKSRKHLYENPFYQSDSTVEILKPDFQLRTLKFWKRFFFYYSHQIMDEYKLRDTQIKQNQSSLQNCRFNEDNIPCLYKKAEDQLAYYESILQHLGYETQKLKSSPKEIAENIQKNIFDQCLQIQQEQSQQQQLQEQKQQQQQQQQQWNFQQQQQQIYEETDIDFLSKSTVDRELTNDKLKKNQF